MEFTTTNAAELATRKKSMPWGSIKSRNERKTLLKDAHATGKHKHSRNEQTINPSWTSECATHLSARHARQSWPRPLMLHQSPPYGSVGVSAHLSSQYRVRLLSEMYALSEESALSSQADAVHESESESETVPKGNKRRTEPTTETCDRKQEGAWRRKKKKRQYADTYTSQRGGRRVRWTVDGRLKGACDDPNPRDTNQ